MDVSEKIRAQQPEQRTAAGKKVLLRADEVVEVAG